MAILPGSSRERARQPVTLLRVHGVHGWSAEETLQSPDAAQVAGDDLSGFYRRQGTVRAGDPQDSMPAGQQDPLTLEAYSWGLFSSKLPTQAFWLLLIPFSFVNLAGWMLRRAPGSAFGKDEEQFELPRRSLGRILRLLGLTLTLEFFLAVIGVMVGILGEQCGVRSCNKEKVSLGWLPPGLSSIHPGLPKDLPGRLTLATLFSVVALAALWSMCWLTRRRYESWPQRAADLPAARDTVNGGPQLAQPAFWRGDERVLRLSLAHSAAVLGLVAVFADQARVHHHNPVVDVLALVLIAISAVAVGVDKVVGLRVIKNRGDKASQGRVWLILLALSGVALVAVSCWLLVRAKAADLSPTGSGGRVFLPHWGAAAAVIGAAQAGLLVLLLIGLIAAEKPWQYWKTTPAALGSGRGWQPLSWGLAALGAAALGAGFAGVMSASAVTISEVAWVTGSHGSESAAGTAQLLPSVFPYLDAGAFCFLVTLCVALVGHLVAVIWRRGGELWTEAQEVPHYPVGPGGWPGSCWKRARRSVGMAGGDQNNDRKCSIWLGYVVAQLPEILMSGLIGGAPWAVGIGVLGAVFRQHVPLVSSLVGNGVSAGISASALVLLGFGMVGLLAAEERSADSRRSVGVLWDVATFWPRLAHPFAPPCYAERAVPELRDRLQWLVSGGGTVVLSSYSQGTVVAAAALMQTEPGLRRRVTLVTLGCPLRRLYGRGFSTYFGFDVLQQLMPAQPGLKRPDWVNVWRSTDYVGGWVMQPGRGTLGAAAGCRDVWIADPLSFDPLTGDSVCPPLLAHLNYFPDALVGKNIAALMPPQAGLGG